MSRFGFENFERISNLAKQVLDCVRDELDRVACAPALAAVEEVSPRARNSVVVAAVAARGHFVA